MSDWLLPVLALLSLVVPLALAWWIIERTDRRQGSDCPAHNRTRRWLRPASRPRQDR